MNYADSEKIRSLMKSYGYKESKHMGMSDVIFLNTCSVRQRAEDKVLGLARKIVKLRYANPQLKVILTGCMAQRVKRLEGEDVSDMKYHDQLVRKLGWVDEIVEIGDLNKIAEILGERPGKYPYSGAAQHHLSKIEAYVPISEGCNNFCTYCVVPYTRGSEVHRGYEEVMKQIRELSSEDYRWITLLGQNVNSWVGETGGKKIAFPELLDAAVSVPGDFWLTFLTSHPKDFSQELIDVMASNKSICEYLNLPVQSGSDRILKLMNRKYTVREYLEKVDAFREKLPNARLSTDIIVGFPGETESDFEQTLRLVEDVKFGMVYLAEYSPRPVAVSASFEGQVSDEIKKRRREILQEVQRKIMKRQNEEALGQKHAVLVTGKGFGKTKDLRDIRLNGCTKELLGQFVEVTVTDGVESGLVGEISV